MQEVHKNCDTKIVMEKAPTFCLVNLSLKVRIWERFNCFSCTEKIIKSPSMFNRSIIQFFFIVLWSGLICLPPTKLPPLSSSLQSYKCLLWMFTSPLCNHWGVSQKCRLSVILLWLHPSSACMKTHFSVSTYEHSNSSYISITPLLDYSLPEGGFSSW